MADDYLASPTTYGPAVSLHTHTPIVFTNLDGRSGDYLAGPPPGSVADTIRKGILSASKILPDSWQAHVQPYLQPHIRIDPNMFFDRLK